MSLFENLIAAKAASSTVANNYQKVIDEKDSAINLWEQANNKLKAENRKHMLLMRAERASRMGWQQNALTSDKLLLDAGETKESIIEASNRLVAAHQDKLDSAFKEEQDRIEREVEAALEKERNGG